LEKSELFETSGLINADAIVTNKPAILGSVICKTPGGVTGEVNVYHGIDATGALIAAFASSDAAPVNFGSAVPLKVNCPNGIFVDLSGAGVTCTVIYKPSSFGS
jgi:hypothetical protein